MNERDAEHMRDLMVQDNHMSVTFIPEEADMVILNTCSIREKPKKRFFPNWVVGEFSKRKSPQLTIAVGGCVASQEGEEIIKEPHLWISFLARKQYTDYLNYTKSTSDHQNRKSMFHFRYTKNSIP